MDSSYKEFKNWYEGIGKSRNSAETYSTAFRKVTFLKDNKQIFEVTDTTDFYNRIKLIIESSKGRPEQEIRQVFQVISEPLEADDLKSGLRAYQEYLEKKDDVLPIVKSPEDINYFKRYLSVALQDNGEYLEENTIRAYIGTAKNNWEKENYTSTNNCDSSKKYFNKMKNDFSTFTEYLKDFIKQSDSAGPTTKGLRNEKITLKSGHPLQRTFGKGNTSWTTFIASGDSNINYERSTKQLSFASNRNISYEIEDKDICKSNELTDERIPEIFLEFLERTKTIWNMDKGPLQKSEDHNQEQNESNPSIIGKNIIYFGVPGSGKSYKINETYCNKNNKQYCERTVFHPEYEFTDFVGGLKPFVQRKITLESNYKEGLDMLRSLNEPLEVNDTWVEDFKMLGIGNPKYYLGMRFPDKRKEDYVNAKNWSSSSDGNLDASTKLSPLYNSTIELLDTQETITYKFIPGPFSRILKKAINNPEQEWTLIIEEINRGNAAAIFGEIFQLLDRRDNTDAQDSDNYDEKKVIQDQQDQQDQDETDTKYNSNSHASLLAGSSEYTIDNEDIAKYVYDDYEKREVGEKNKIYIPHNLNIVASMNTSDQNVFTLDNAFQRRFEFKRMSNEFKDEDKQSEQYQLEIPETTIKWGNFRDIINKQINNMSDDFSSEDQLLGPYFVTKKDCENLDKFKNKVIRYLWNDVCRLDKTQIFSKDIGSLQDIYDEINFEKIFSVEIKNKLGKEVDGKTTLSDTEDIEIQNDNEQENTTSDNGSLKIEDN